MVLARRGEECILLACSGNEGLCWGFGQSGPYQMKSRPLKEGGVGEGQGPGRVEGATGRIEQLAESRVQPQDTQSPDTLSTVGISSARRAANTQALVLLSATRQQVWAHNHTQSSGRSTRRTAAFFFSPLPTQSRTRIQRNTQLFGVLSKIG